MTLLQTIGQEIRTAVRSTTSSGLPVAFDNTVPLDASFGPTAVGLDDPLVEFRFGSAGAGEPRGLGAQAAWTLEGRSVVSVRSPLDEGEDEARGLLEQITDALGPKVWPTGIEYDAASLLPGTREGGSWVMRAECPWTIRYWATLPGARRSDLGGSFVDVGAAIRDAFVETVGADLGLEVELPSVERQGSTDAAAPSLQLFMLPGQRIAVAGDGEVDQLDEFGLVQLQTYWPLATGSDQAFAAVDSVLDLIRALRTGVVAFDAPFFETIGIDGEQWRLDVFAPYTARTAEVH